MRALHLTGLSIAIAMGVTTQVLAHPGHGMTEPESPVHYLVEPVHGWWMLLGLVLAAATIIAWKIRSQKTEKLPARSESHDRITNSDRR